MKVNLPEPMKKAIPVLQVLEEAGHTAVFVGGAVRDTILGIQLSDVDIAASSLPEETSALFEHVIPTGIAHGTVTVIYHGESYEITTFRKEAGYEDFRRPESVTYVTDLYEDLKRRDFTMNAMALYKDGILEDPFDGIAHLNKQLLAAAGNAEERFSEDALRMLRGIRFLSVYTLQPQVSVWRAIRRYRKLMCHIAMERVCSELDKLIMAANPMRALQWLEASCLLQYLKEPLPLPATSYALAHLEDLATANIRWLAFCLFHQFNEKQLLSWCKSLRYSNSQTLLFRSIAALHNELRDMQIANSITQEQWVALVLKYGKNSACTWLKINSVLCRNGMNFLSEEATNNFKKKLSEILVFNVKDLRMNGNDLQKKYGRAAGAWIKSVLERLLLMTACGQLANEKEILLAAADLLLDERL